MPWRRLARPALVGERLGVRETAQPQQYGDLMSDGPTEADAFPATTERDAVLNDVGAKWRRFSRKELSALTCNDDLVDGIVAKYGIDKEAAQRDVDAMMDGRNLTA
jgi:hypothetical protein